VGARLDGGQRRSRPRWREPSARLQAGRSVGRAGRESDGRRGAPLARRAIRALKASASLLSLDTRGRTPQTRVHDDCGAPIPPDTAKDLTANLSPANHCRLR
jgi:hypothetical protein